MALAAGSHLGPYQVLALLGAGGMGEVYRARDARLGRDVAVKVLSEGSAEPEAVRRFRQEALAVAALNHPNILGVFDTGVHEGRPYIVFELLEGETLRARMAGGRLSVRQAIAYAVQTANALAAAHEAGVIHRDLKPDNLFITRDGRLKVLDFGLAKLRLQWPDADQGATASALSQPGTILGTVGYMSPEQVQGRPVDHRTDVFSLGVVLHEMLSGQRPFRRETAAETMTAILKDEPPDLAAMDQGIPPVLERITHRCLEKRREERFQSARDLAFAIEASPGSSVEAPGLTAGEHAARGSGARRRAAAAAILVFVLALAAAALLRWVAHRPTSEPASTGVTRFLVTPPAGTFLVSPERGGATAVSPDGRHLVFVARGADGKRFIWLRPLDSTDARSMAGTEGAEYPFWSPDSRFVAFFADGKLKKVDLLGVPPQTIADAPSGRGGAWNGGGVIVFAPRSAGGLYRVPAAGGDPAPLTTLDAAQKETTHRWPCFLPDGRHFVFLALKADPRESTLRVGSLDPGPLVTLGASGFNAAFAPPAHLLFLREGTLVARPFDRSRMELSGDALAVAADVSQATPTRGYAAFSVSRGGVLAYQMGSSGESSQLVWIDRAGKQIGTVGPVAGPESFLARPGYRDPALSPDGRRIAANMEDPQTGTWELWLLDGTDAASSRFTFNRAGDWLPVWSPDGGRIAFASNRDGGRNRLYVKSVTGAGSEELLLSTEGTQQPTDWSLDGRYIVYEQANDPGKRDLWVLPMSGDRRPIPFLHTEADEFQGQISPDGRWMAYGSDESGRFEIYVQPFPGLGGKWQVSTGGGTQPRWRRDGTELFYLSTDKKIMVAAVRKGAGAFDAGVPRALCAVEIGGVLGLGTDEFVPSADGQRFLVARTAEPSAWPITVVLDWPASLKR
jgi:Tol biopolymer transport system component